MVRFKIFKYRVIHEHFQHYNPLYNKSLYLLFWKLKLAIIRKCYKPNACIYSYIKYIEKLIMHCILWNPFSCKLSSMDIIDIPSTYLIFCPFPGSFRGGDSCRVIYSRASSESFARKKLLAPSSDIDAYTAALEPSHPLIPSAGICSN